MRKFTTAALASAALLALPTLPIATPAFAQGSLSPFPRQSGCPNGWSSGRAGQARTPNPDMCYPGSSAVPAYPNPSGKSCAEGYSKSAGYCASRKEEYSGPTAADQLVSYGTITKANRADRCPLGYFSKADMATCTTQLSPAPKSRRKAGACRANEIDEWGLYCTADAGTITRQQAEQEATRDFNAIYSANGANYPNQGSDTENYPSMVAAYGPKGKGGGSSASQSSSGSSDTGSAPAANCTTTSATGSAIGGMLGGQAGAALGGMLGGKSKKKKNGC